MHQPQPPQHSAAPPPSIFVREATNADLLWSIKKAIARARTAGITDVEPVCAEVEEHARRRVRWAQQDGDAVRLEQWSGVVRAIDSDPAGLAVYVARRLEWLGLSAAEQEQRLAANRRPPSTAQIRLLSRLGGDVHIEDAWQASRAIDKLLREQRS